MALLRPEPNISASFPPPKTLQMGTPRSEIGMDWESLGVFHRVLVQGKPNKTSSHGLASTWTTVTKKQGKERQRVPFSHGHMSNISESPRNGLILLVFPPFYPEFPLDFGPFLSRLSEFFYSKTPSAWKLEILVMESFSAKWPCRSAT